MAWYQLARQLVLTSTSGTTVYHSERIELNKASYLVVEGQCYAFVGDGTTPTVEVIPEVSDDGDNYTAVDAGFKLSFTAAPAMGRDQHTTVVSGRFVRLRYNATRGGGATIDLTALLAAGLSVAEA